MDTSFIITFIGDDRPGLVEELSSIISAQGGNWLESRLTRLAGKFAGLIRVSLPAERGDELERALRGLSERGLSVRVTPAWQVAQTSDGVRDIRLTIFGLDRAGIVREVAAALAAKNINIVELESSVESAPMSAELLFRATVEAQLGNSGELDALAAELDEIARQMLLDIHLEPLF
ncbi:MAG: ACT domain-containing protein [Halieaceae bacterium]|nr:ACT domain-containing protein [Halieaceae bacterium]